MFSQDASKVVVLYLKENKNGLLMIDTADLCQSDVKSTAAAFVASSVCAPPPSLESEIPASHADAPGSARGSPQSGRGSFGQSEASFLMTMVFAMTSVMSRIWKPRSSRWTLWISWFTRWLSNAKRSISWGVWFRPSSCRSRLQVQDLPWGRGVFQDPEISSGRDGAIPKSSCINGAKLFPIDASRDDECQSLQPASSNANEAANAAIANDTKCPSTSRSDGKPSVFLRSFRDWKPTVTHASLESWGNKIVGFGKKHLRSRYAHVCESDPGYIKWILTWAGRQPLRGCGGFRKLCPSSQATGTIGQQSGPMRGNWEGFQESRMSHRTNFKERQLLNEADNMCMKSVTTKLNSWTS